MASKYVPHFSELEIGEDLFYMKCQLIMHIIDQILGETHFFSVARELFKKAKPCAKCGYDKHVELCHIKSMSSFPDSALVKEVNNRKNI